MREKMSAKKNSVLWQLLKFMRERGKAKSVAIDICIFLVNDDEMEKKFKIFMVKK